MIITKQIVTGQQERRSGIDKTSLALDCCEEGEYALGYKHDCLIKSFSTQWIHAR